jgi:hypothetical protein
MDDQTRRALENIWRQRVDAARLRHQEQSKAFREVWEDHFDARLNADGAHAIQRAREAESKALNEDVRALRIFAELVTQGKTPPEE